MMAQARIGTLRVIFRSTIAFLMLIATLTDGRQAGAVEPSVLLRYGEHSGFGRIVFDIEASEKVVVQQNENVVKVFLPSGIKIPVGRPPHNIIKVVEGPDALLIEILPGAHFRKSIVNTHLVIDVLDPPLSGTKPAAALPVSASLKLPADVALKARTTPDQFTKAAPSVLSPPPNAALSGQGNGSNPGADTSKSPDRQLEKATPSYVNPTMPPSLIPSLQSQPIEHLKLPMTSSSLAAVADSVPEFGPGHMLSLPFGPNAGAAAFRRGDEVFVVFDERKPIDLQALKADAIFGNASVQLLPAATVLKINLPAPAELRLARTPRAWVVTAIGGNAVANALKSITPEQSDGRMTLKADQPGLIVSVPDPVTGGVLQIGTQRSAGQGVAVTRRTPDFVLNPTWQGVVVGGLADGVSLQAIVLGFSIGADGVGTTLSASQPDQAALKMADASQMSRIFDFPNLRTDSLLRRMQGAVAAAAAVPAAARGAARQEVAEAMMALGMAAEAQSVLELATATDARIEQAPVRKALAAAAGLLSGRGSDADGLDDHKLDGSDEIAIWRALKTAFQMPENAAAAEVLANAAPLLLSYPQDLLQRLLPRAVETMVLGGQGSAARKIMDARAGDTSLDLARAYLQQRNGDDPSSAIAMFQKLTASPNRLVRVRAARAAAELQLATGQSDAGRTAQVLAKLLYAWRGDEQEIDLRLRVAQLYAKANEWRSSLQLLRETAQLWPERGEQLRARLVTTFAASISPSSQAGLKPFDLVTMAEENADLMPDGEPGLRLAEHVTQALAELELPGREIPYLEKMITTTPKGAAQAAFGGRLSQVRLEQGDIAGALEVLKSTVPEAMPPELLESRTLVFASSVARLGDMASAVNALTQLDTPAGDLLLADLAEKSQRWPDAVAAMRRIVARDVPSDGALREDQAMKLLRFASAASEANDSETISKLRDRELSNLPVGRTADLIQLILTRPIGGVAELPRASREIVAARAVATAAPKVVP
jgi:hypothetical protein